MKRYIVKDSLEGVTFATAELIWTGGAPRDKVLSRAQARKMDHGEEMSFLYPEPWGWDRRGGRKGDGCFRPVEIVGVVEVDMSLAAKWAKVKWRECLPVDATRWNDVVGAVHEEILGELELGPETALSFGQGADAGGWRSVTLFFPTKCCH